MFPLDPPPRPYRVPRPPPEVVTQLRQDLTAAIIAANRAKTPQEWAAADAERERINKRLLEIAR